jgi:pilus assembly protein CpaC
MVQDRFIRRCGPAGLSLFFILTTAVSVLAIPRASLAAGTPTEVRVGESIILTLPYRVKRFSVTVQETDENAPSDKKITNDKREPKGPALVQVISADETQTEMKIDGQYVGKSTLIVWDKDGKKAFFDITVVLDTSELMDRITEVAPGDKVQVRVLKNSVIVSGSVSNEERKARIDSILKSFGRDVKSRDLVYLEGGVVKEVDNTGSADDKGIKYVNLLEVTDTPQVQMQIVVASIDRTATRELGINWAYAGRSLTIDSAVSSVSPGLSNISNLLSGTKSGGLATDGINGANLGIIHSPSGTQYLLRALASKGLAKVLAEPNLIVRSGEIGRFLAGGEFPIPVVQSANIGGGTGNQTSITVIFKEFGVKLNLTPVIKENGNIEIRMCGKPKAGDIYSEDEAGIIVSSLDFANAVELSGFKIPALKKDYVNTNVELKENESFVVAGLINEEWTKNLDKIPFLGDIPILGAFFRDQKLQKTERELVFFITPKLMRPMMAGEKPQFPGVAEPTREQNEDLSFVPKMPTERSNDPEKLK